MVDILSPETTFQAWGGKTDTKLPWDKDPAFCEAVRGGLTVDNVLSIQTGKESQRMRRLVGPPFAKKFLLDQEQIFKNCTKTLIMNLEKLRKENNNVVNVSIEFRKYAFDILSDFD
jgi:cytochrome P450